MPIPASKEGQINAVDERIWRYMSFPQFLKFYRTGGLLFRRVADFDDPYEGSVPKSVAEARPRVVEHLDNASEGHGKFLRELTRNAQRFCYANCWHVNEKESAAMWEHYGKKGVAVVTTSESLIEAFADSRGVFYAQPVSYFDYYKSFDELGSEERDQLSDFFDTGCGFTLVPLFLKRESFSHENELRIVTHEIGLMSTAEYESAEYNIVVDGERAKFWYEARPIENSGIVDFRDVPEESKKEVEVDVPELVEEVRVAPQAGDWFFHTVREAVDELGPDSLSSDDVRRSNTDENEPVH